jgi:hypothetical protein
MSSIVSFFLAQPWWVNLLIFVPILTYYFAKQTKLKVSKTQLFKLALFGIGFGIIEATVVIYLRLLAGIIKPDDLLSDSGSTDVNLQAKMLSQLPSRLIGLESFREAATIAIFVCIALLTTKRTKERWIVFVWTFAAWDLMYYVFLWFVIRWPSSLTTLDILFLIPVPWLSQIWFPLLVSILTLASIALLPKETKVGSLTDSDL